MIKETFSSSENVNELYNFFNEYGKAYFEEIRKGAGNLSLKEKTNHIYDFIYFEIDSSSTNIKITNKNGNYFSYTGPGYGFRTAYALENAILLEAYNSSYPSIIITKDSEKNTTVTILSSISAKPTINASCTVDTLAYDTVLLTNKTVYYQPNVNYGATSLAQIPVSDIIGSFLPNMYLMPYSQVDSVGIMKVSKKVVSENGLEDIIEEKYFTNGIIAVKMTDND